jgi:hypothetical protein
MVSQILDGTICLAYHPISGRINNFRATREWQLIIHTNQIAILQSQSCEAKGIWKLKAGHQQRVASKFPAR